MVVVRPLDLRALDPFRLEHRRFQPSNANRPVTRQSYRFDAAEQVEDFRPFARLWTAERERRRFPALADVMVLADRSPGVIVHTIETGSEDPNLWTFSRFDPRARIDGRDFSGTRISDYPDASLREAGLIDHTTAAWMNQASVIRVEHANAGMPRTYLRLVLPFGDGGRRTTGLASVIRLLSFRGPDRRQSSGDADCEPPEDPCPEPSRMPGIRMLARGHEAVALGIVCRDAFLVDANQHFMELVGRADCLRLDRMRLHANSRDQTDILHRLIKKLCDAKHPAAGSVLKIAKNKKEGYLVARFEPLLFASGAGTDGACVVSVIDPMREIALPVSMLRQAFGFTVAEARVAVRLVSGATPEEIARAGNVSVGTVRNQIKAIFKKVSVSRQSDLVRIMANLASLSPHVR
ncbi:helix-turn-helix transcriptional regulator [Arenibaculum sp.]|uniref:helix-turn-helix transcriptional regulator n=1 Tax=Arenibaculum sp. TaxID=2865862 RepID=UPI002E0EF8A2|nr:helix-turn-helix transcriptional regulator [Arenibaculum sp.]